MTEPASPPSRRGLLDLPDEPALVRRGTVAGFIAGLAAIAVAFVLARTFGLGGWTRPWLSVGIALGVPSALLAWLATGEHRWRSGITAAVMVVAVALVPAAQAGATPSVNRLAQVADSLRLPGTIEHEVRIGNGRCRPACSEIRRTAYSRGPSFADVEADVQLSLRHHRYAVRSYAYAIGQPARIDASKGKILVSLELRSIDLATVRVASIFIANGPAPHHSVG